MSYMFYGCRTLDSLPDISKMNIYNITNMSHMFYGCKSLRTLPDISNWNTSNITDISYMFYGCKSLKPLPAITKWNTNKISNNTCIFDNCQSGIIYINNEEYKKIKKLGEDGGIGKEYKVQSKKNNNYYFIKRIYKSKLNEEEINSLKKDIKILISLEEEYIIKYYNIFEDEKYFNILMEYYEGPSLKEMINKNKEKNELLDEEKIGKISLAILFGIKYFHSKQLIHKNLKPENIFIEDNGSIKIGDLDIYKKIEINKNMELIGANFYTAPEIINGEGYDNRVDMWSYGCILYELLTLNVCFQSKSVSEYIDKITKKSHGKIDLKKYNQKWQELIDLLLIKNYKERIDTNKAYELLSEFIGIDSTMKIKEKKEIKYSESFTFTEDLKKKIEEELDLNEKCNKIIKKNKLFSQEEPKPITIDINIFNDEVKKKEDANKSKIV